MIRQNINMANAILHCDLTSAVGKVNRHTIFLSGCCCCIGEARLARQKRTHFHETRNLTKMP